MEYNEWYVMGSRSIFITQLESKYGKIGWRLQYGVLEFEDGFRDIDNINSFEKNQKLNLKVWEELTKDQKNQMIRDLYGTAISTK